MPEGDTILRAARTLARALENRPLLRFRSAVPGVPTADLAGRSVLRVEARGKHLLFHFDDGRSLHTHMQMTGSWHIYRPGEAWRKPERLARVVLENAEYVAVCFNAPVVELLSRADAARHPVLSRLGPDLLRPEFDAGEARERLRALGRAAVGEALLSQRAIAGIGNIYKSEALFVARIDPFAPVAALSEEDLDRVIGTARRLMAANVDGNARSTRPGLGGTRYWVYERSGRPCLACGTLVRMRRQGDAGRSTYWCPSCQSGRGDPRPVSA